MRTWGLLAALLLVGVLLWEFVPIYRCVWVGGFSFQVAVKSGRPAAITAVSCQPCHSVEEADEIVKYRRHFEKSGVMSADPFTGDPLTVYVGTTGATSWWGRELRYHQPGYLAVLVTFADGTREGKVVAISDVRRDQTVEVEFR